MLFADRIVVLTEEYRNELCKAHRWFFRPHKVKIIPNGIDSFLFYPNSLNNSKSKLIRLGMAARFSFSKRQDLLIDALSLVLEQRPDISFELHFAGDGDHLDHVKALVSNSSIAAHIHFDGLLSESQVAEWLKSMDIYLHATAGESFCMSVLQAMATGLPIIASANVGITVVNGDGSDGILVDNYTNLWATEIIKLIDDCDRRKRMGFNARKKAVDLYSAEASLKSYLELVLSE